MRRFAVKKIYALNNRGRHIAGTIEPVHPGYWLDLPDGESKLHLFALTRRGKEQAQAKTLRLVVEPAAENGQENFVEVEVLYAHTFGVEDLPEGDYWDELPESLRLAMQDRMADELMERAAPIPATLFSTLGRQRYPYRGVAFAVSGLDQLAALFPPEAAA